MNRAFSNRGGIEAGKLGHPKNSPSEKISKKGGAFTLTRAPEVLDVLVLKKGKESGSPWGEGARSSRGSKVKAIKIARKKGDGTI